MTRELLQQALDALEWYAECSVVAGKASDAANAIRAALAAPQGEPVKGAVWHEGSVSLLSVGHEDAYCARRGAQRLYLHPPAAPSGEAVCKKCGADRLREPCKGSLMDCGFTGMTNAAPSGKGDKR